MFTRATSDASACWAARPATAGIAAVARVRDGFLRVAEANLHAADGSIELFEAYVRAVQLGIPAESAEEIRRFQFGRV